MASCAYSTNADLRPDHGLAPRLKTLNWVELLGFYEILRATVESVQGRLAQPRVTSDVEKMLDAVSHPIEAMVDAVVAEARSRQVHNSNDRDFKAQIVLADLIRSGELDDVAVVAVELMGALRAH